MNSLQPVQILTGRATSPEEFAQMAGKLEQLIASPGKYVRVDFKGIDSIGRKTYLISKIEAPSGLMWLISKIFIVGFECGVGGLTQNMEEALKWYRLAADGGNEKAKECIERLTQQTQ
ncbi:MAG: SEL1-like repeat protein [Parachlamydiaceae bacterium]|nr:SEL1-like repeat protein [Parachlamydiaceae bacterium]